MALANDALITVEEARVYLRDPEAAFELLELYVSGYSRVIRRYTVRQFLPAEAALAKRYRYDGSGYLSLAPSELRSVSSIVLHTDLPSSSQVTLSAGDASNEAEYRLEPRNKTIEETYLWLTLPLLSFSEARYLKGAEVTVNGDWGVTAAKVPADVKLACLIAVANAYRSPEGYASRSLGEFSLSETQEDPDEAGRALPPDARALLFPYKREGYS